MSKDRSSIVIGISRKDMELVQRARVAKRKQTGEELELAPIARSAIREYCEAILKALEEGS